MNSILKKIVWLVMAAPAVYLALVWNKLPERVAMHFDLKGNPDRFGNKSELITMILILAVVNAVVYLILTNIYRIDPKKMLEKTGAGFSRLLLPPWSCFPPSCAWSSTAVPGEISGSVQALFSAAPVYSLPLPATTYPT